MTYTMRVGRKYDTVGNPQRTQICQFDFFEPILLLKLDKQLPVEQFEATVSESTVPSPPLSVAECQWLPDEGQDIRFVCTKVIQTPCILTHVALSAHVLP